MVLVSVFDDHVGLDTKEFEREEVARILLEDQ
jgi:hypothetical protein